MPKLNIDIGTTSYQNVRDVSTRGGISPILINGYKNEAGSDVRRPGLSLHCTLTGGIGIDGLYWSSKQNITLAVTNGMVFKIEVDGQFTKLTGASLNVGRKVSFEEVATDSNIYMANGGKIIYTDGATLSTLATSPQAVTTIDYMSGYLFAEDEFDRKIYFTNQLTVGTDPTFVLDGTQEIDPAIEWDEVRGIKIVDNEIFTFGSESTQIWFQTGDATDPFNSLDGAFLDDGILTRDAIEKIGDEIYYLNKRKEVVKIVGRQKQVISNPFEKELQSFDDISDARSMQIFIDGKKFYVLCLKKENITYVYDTVLNYWSQFSYWDLLDGENDIWEGYSHTYNRSANKHYVGDITTGKIYVFDPDTHTDNGNVIRFVRRTGHIDHGTLDWKHSSEFQIKIRRGIKSYGLTDPQATIRWHNNGSQDWTPLKFIDMGGAGDHNHIHIVRRNGRYRTRQYEIVITEAMPFELVNPFVEEVMIGNPDG